MRWISLLLMLFFYISGQGQWIWKWKDYKINANGDTLNRIDQWDRKQGPWVHHYDKVRGEPGYEEEGWYEHNRKEGEWRMYNLIGDLVGIERYKWGFKDGACQYFNMHGGLRLEQSWKALNPDKEYDTLEIEDPDKLDTYRTVIVKNEGAALRHGPWKYYNESGELVRTEQYELGELKQAQKDDTAGSAGENKSVPKPKEVMDFEKKNSGKKKVKVRTGSTGG